jgi:hypothetical protein
MRCYEEAALPRQPTFFTLTHPKDPEGLGLAIPEPHTASHHIFGLIMCQYNSAVARPQACHFANPDGWKPLLVNAAAAGADISLVKINICVDLYVWLM